MVNLTLNYSISTISLASVGHLGTTELAAAALVRHCHTEYMLSLSYAINCEWPCPIARPALVLES